MKRPFTIYDLRFTIWKKSAKSFAANHQSSIINHQSRSGVALIITLILLAVVTFMALTFLAISQRERGAVTTTTDTVTAQLAADDALASAEAQVVANLLATSNSYNFGLLVSTNYINPLGFQTGVADPTNVNYYYGNGNPLNLNDFLQNLANLYYLPRTPVFVPTNAAGLLDFRFYLDLNRNGQDDPNGLVPEIGPTGGFIHPNGTEDSINANVVSNYQVGDPEWVGVLQHPDQPYGPNNPFVARYAFIAAPIGNALDLNAIHNQVLDEYGDVGLSNKRGVPVNPSPAGPIPGGQGDGFMRNQGVGSWEINLAAFLADLNTNQWYSNTVNNLYYKYHRADPFLPGQPGPSPNLGVAFDDARALLTYRYQNNYLSLKLARFMFPNNGAVFQGDNIDGYSDGPLQIVPPPINEVGIPAIRDNPAFSWSGADNTNHYFDAQELFDTTKTALGLPAVVVQAGNDFSDRLLNADKGVATYDRYTYYRLLSQMGVASTPEQNKLNLNYLNVDAGGNVVPGMETNFIPWANALQFFTNAADRMLRDYSQQWLVESPSNYVATFNMTANIGTPVNPTNMPVSFGLANIPVLVSNRLVYTPAVQRVLQLAANIYDATVNNATNGFPDWPDVFRPTFLVTNDTVSGYTNVYINGYEQVVSVTLQTSDSQLNLPVEVTALRTLPFGPGTWTNVNIYGVPWIVGAKKGWPNFNEFAMESVFQLTRKLQVTRPSTNAALSSYQYNQMFNLSITNQFGVECWNSYTNDYTRSVDMFVTCTNSYLFTNEEGLNNGLGSLISGSLHIDMNSNANNGWPGYNPVGNSTAVLLSPASFQMPLNTNIAVITNSMYRFNGGAPFLTTNLALPYETGVNINGNRYPQPHWVLITSNDVRVIILDTSTSGTNHVLDYVQLSGPNSVRDLTPEIVSQYDTDAGPSGNAMWNTNIQNGVPSGPIGIISQIGVSLGNYTAGAASGAWNATSQTERENEIDGFRAFFGLGQLYNNPGEDQVVAQASSTNAIQAPYTPSAAVVQHFSWQANDPLVHYTTSDLNWPGANRLDRTPDDLTNEDVGKLNQRYMPWGGNPVLSGADQNPYNLALKDPLVYSSDDWDFPTYKLPSVGWLGRVHRGTPWQTVYLKSRDVLAEAQTNGATITPGTNVWALWTGNAPLANGQNFDAINTAPAQDRLLFDIFSTALNDNATRGQLSVNVGASDPSPQAGLATWSALFSGVLVLSNNAVDGAISTNVVLQHNGSLANFTSFPINPAGPGAASSALGQIVTNINLTRATFINADGLTGSFEHVGDILAVPQLTAKSPFLNWFDNGDPMQQINGISDEMYEWLPEQVMSLLHVSDSPRFVIYSYGQALKPAPSGISTANLTLANGQSAFGMVTNYQVVTESATRAVVRFNGARTDSIIQTNDGVSTSWIAVPSITNNNAVVEEFNILPSN